MAYVPVFTPEDRDQTEAVACVSCKWSGPIGECKQSINDLVRCPKCDQPVEVVN